MSDEYGHQLLRPLDGVRYPEEYYAPADRLRPMSIVIIVVDALLAVWFVWGLAEVVKTCSEPAAELEQDFCAAGGVVGLGFVLGVGAAVNIVLGVLWLVTHPRGRIPSR